MSRFFNWFAIMDNNGNFDQGAITRHMPSTNDIIERVGTCVINSSSSSVHHIELREVTKNVDKNKTAIKQRFL